MKGFFLPVIKNYKNSAIGMQYLWKETEIGQRARNKSMNGNLIYEKDGFAILGGTQWITWCWD